MEETGPPAASASGVDDPQSAAATEAHNPPAQQEQEALRAPSEEQQEAQSLMEKTLIALVRQVVNGIPGVPSQEPVVDAARRLLDKCDGDVGKAVQSVAVTADSAWGDSCIRFLAGLVPLGGMAVRLETLWVQLRAVALVAALYGHDVQDSVICNRMVLCLVDARISGPAPPRSPNHDPLALGAKRVVSDVARRVSNGGTVSVFVDSLAGNSVEAVVVRAQSHFAPQNKFSNLWLMLLVVLTAATRVVKPAMLGLNTATTFAEKLLESEDSPLGRLHDILAMLPFGSSVMFATVTCFCLLAGLIALLIVGRLTFAAARSSPSVFTFVVMSVPPLVQAFLAGSAAESLGTALTNGTLFRV